VNDAITTIALIWSIVLLALAVLAVLRARGSFARILALDTAALMLIGVLLMLAKRDDEPYYLDAALILAALSFVSTIAAARYRAENRPF
jgi:multisubunit Na+/H+ antiporter MnhF subunit